MYKKTFQDYIPLCDQEIEDKKAILKFISLNDDCFLRSNLIAHITSSAIVVNEKMDKVLCIHHNIYNSWGWVGGHNDGNPNLLEVAIKEAIEETGVTEIAPYSDEVLGIDIIYVVNHIKNGKHVSDHLHLNATYLLIADENEKLVIKPDENSGVKWFYIKEVLDYVTEDRMKTVYSKLFNRVNQYKAKKSE